MTSFERQVQLLRAEYGKHLDPTGAFVDRLVLNVYAGPGATTVWIDDVDIAGLVHPQSVSSGVPARQISSQPPGSTIGERCRRPGLAANGQAKSTRSIQLSGSTLMVDQTPLFPRIIQHQGESLAFLRGLGFNTVLLSGQPSAELLSEASAAGMWLITQPPALEELQRQPGATIGAQYAPVLAWHLGSGLGEREAEHTRAWAKLTKRADTATRPIIATPDTELRGYSRNLDGLVVSRESLGTTLDLWDYYAWLRQRPQLARLGTPIWSTVPSQMPAKWREQVIGLTAGRISEAELGYSQMRAVSILSLAAGVRGLVFGSDAPLDGSDRGTQIRAARLALLNLELQLIEPWTVGASGTAVADCSDSSVAGLVLSTQRGRLLVPLPKASGQQAAFGGWPTGPISFTIPGASTASDAFELTPAGLRPLAHSRIAGGTRIVLDGSHESLVVLTHDRLLLTTITRRMAKIAERTIELQRLSVDQQLASAVGLEPVSNETADGKGKAATPETVARQLLSSTGESQKHSDPTERWLRAAHRRAGSDREHAACPDESSRRCERGAG